jgi:hypothetical protein
MDSTTILIFIINDKRINSMNKKLLRAIIFAIVITSKFCFTYASQPASEEVYREKVFLHLARNTFISGESIFFKAYCFNAADNKPAVRSKVLYVELIDFNKKHVLGKVLEIKEGTASSSIILPDSLSSGTYMLMAYTNWMRNFNPENFYSSTIFIQNPFSDVSLKNFNLSNTVDFKVYLEGGGLIDGLTNNVAIRLPFIPTGRVTAIISDESNNQLDSIQFDSKGLAIFKLLPVGGKSYHCIVSGGYFRDHLINLPTVGLSGYQISLDKETSADLIFRILSSHALIENSKLEIYCENSKIKEIPLSDLSKNTSFEIAKESFRKGIIKILLKDNRDRILAYNYFNYPQTSSNLQIDSVKQTYKTREKISLSLSLKDGLKDSSSNFSISVSKQSPMGSALFDNDISENLLTTSDNNAMVSIVDMYGVAHLLAAEKSKNMNYENYSVNDISDFEYPAEDMGNLYQGKCINTKNNLPAGNIKVVISEIDSLPSIQGSTTDAKGIFAFILKGSGSKNILLQAFRNDTIMDNTVKILLNNKYHFANTAELSTAETWPIHDTLFKKFMEDEIKRFEINRAFEMKKDVAIIPSLSEPRPSAFYGLPDYNIKIDEYVFLNNFQEVINEIITYTKYNKKRKGCELTVFNPDYNVYYENPITLVDGIPVNNLCLLYSLNSNDIANIEVQNHERIAGNIIYKGLVSVYLKGNTKKFHNLLLTGNKIMTLDGYQNEDDSEINNFSGTISPSDKRPYFMSQLYWNPSIRFSGTESKDIEFYTSDEEGEFLLDIQGINSKGKPIHEQKTFLVKNH